MTVFDMDSIRRAVFEDTHLAHRALVKLDVLNEYLEKRERDFPMPDGANVSNDFYALRYGSINVTVPEVEGRPWRGMHGTAGIIARVRRHMGVPKLTRSLRYDGATVFSGEITVNGFWFSVSINVGKQLPDSCTLVEEEVTATVTRKQYRTVCS